MDLDTVRPPGDGEDAYSAETVVKQVPRELLAHLDRMPRPAKVPSFDVSGLPAADRDVVTPKASAEVARALHLDAPVEVAPVEVAPVEVAPVEVAPVEVAPVEVAPVEVAPVGTLASLSEGTPNAEAADLEVGASSTRLADDVPFTGKDTYAGADSGTYAGTDSGAGRGHAWLWIAGVFVVGGLSALLWNQCN